MKTTETKENKRKCGKQGKGKRKGMGKMDVNKMNISNNNKQLKKETEG